MSSNDIAISVHALSKAYTIARGGPERQSTLAETVLHRLRRPFDRVKQETFWALRDLSFDVREGEVVGIIGRNGAGKSTLLKILSRITEPTGGSVELYGRVGSLLEVGTGFHPELTGRENIYLNGQILGMRRKEIDRQFDAIVDFAGVERFLDTPVKRYSSGMYVRLAFAVAAHLNPDILVVDEVLAVGDAEFQEKCIGKMREVSRLQGRTVLFVSHNLVAVRQLCTAGLLLDRGRIVASGPVASCVERYVAVRERGEGSWSRPPEMPARPLAIMRVDSSLEGEQPLHRLCIRLDLATTSSHAPAFLAVDVLDAGGVAIMQALPRLRGFIPDDRASHRVGVEIELPPLVPGQYAFGVWVGSHNTETLDEVRQCGSFEVLHSPTKGRTFPHTPDHGLLVPPSVARYEAVEVDDDDSDMCCAGDPADGAAEDGCSLEGSNGGGADS